MRKEDLHDRRSQGETNTLFHSKASRLPRILAPPGWRFFGEGLAGGLSEEHDQGIEEVVREELQGACGDGVAEADLGGSG